MLNDNQIEGEPGAPISSFGVESCLDELARELNIDPLALRERNAAKDGTKAVHGPTWTKIGYLDTLAAAKNHPNYQIPLRPNQGRGIACGFNVGGESSAQVHVNEDGSVSVASGSRDISGSRALMAMMAAETLGIPVERVKPIASPQNKPAPAAALHAEGAQQLRNSITVPSCEVAAKIGRNLVEERLSACVSIISGMHSIYVWRDKIETATEVVLIAKTRRPLRRDRKARKRIAPLRLPLHRGVANRGRPRAVFRLARPGNGFVSKNNITTQDRRSADSRFGFAGELTSPGALTIA